MTPAISESIVESATLEWFTELEYVVLSVQEIAPNEPHAGRSHYEEVVLSGRLHYALKKINPTAPAEALNEAIRQVLFIRGSNLTENNHSFHKLLVDGIEVEYRSEGGLIKHSKVWLVDFEEVDNNDWLVINQFRVIENRNERRADVVVFVNGLPLGLIELKNPGDESATLKKAFKQLETYKREVPSLFVYNEVLVVSDGLEARIGTLTSEWERFMPWRTVEGDMIASKGMSELGTLLKGVFQKKRFLDLLQYFVGFEVDGPTISKKLAAYHQYHAVNKAVDCTVRATSPGGDQRVGVIWHTQGSGKSLSMVFYAGKIIRHPAMRNPTLVILTDRNDLDDQLFDNFSAYQDVLRQQPVQAESRDHLRELLQVVAGGVIFTTIQKFVPNKSLQGQPLSDRRNIVFIADEAHRSQYDFIDGFARYMRDALPKASFIGFTGTPIETGDRNTRIVFGDYIDIYDVQQAVEDGTTVRIYYEARTAHLELKNEERPEIDLKFQEVTEGQELEKKERLKNKWTRLEALVGNDKRVYQVSRDIVEHFESRLVALEGKGMIVCMSRQICAKMYKAIIKLRPEWHNPDIDKGVIKVVMTSSASDPEDWQLHNQNKSMREAIARRFKDPDDPLKLVIVRDMWLTGFDVPPLHTMYVDKPMQGHGLMQAIARVNRVFKDKPGGLVVDYLGLADHLRLALSHFTKQDRDQIGIPQEKAVAAMLEKYEIIKAILHGFNYNKFLTSTPRERLSGISSGMEHILKQENGKSRFMKATTELSKAFALAVPNELALVIRDEVGYFQTLRAAFAKVTMVEGRDVDDMDSAVQQIVSKALVSDQVIDIFAATGLKKPDISILSDEFLEEVRDLPYRNLALEVLQRLLNDEIKVRSRMNLVQSRSFEEMLEQAVKKYHNRSIEVAQIIDELIILAKEMREAQKRGEELALSPEELAFYDALEVNDSAVKMLGDENLRNIARELTQTVRLNTTIDWTIRESVRAKLRVLVKRLLRKYGYPPDKQEKAVQTVLEQAELLSKEWAAWEIQSPT